MESIRADISHTSFTLTQLQHQVELWRELVETALFSNTSNTALERYQAAVARLPKTERQLVKQWDASQWLEKIDPETFTTYVERLREWAASVQAFVVYVPVELSELEEGILASAVRTQYDPESFVDVRIDPNVTGGCAFIHNEQYYDYSLHGELKRRPEVMSEIFNAYVE